MVSLRNYAPWQGIELPLLLISVAACCVLVFSQVPDTLWTRTYGGEYDDNGSSVIVTNTGQFIIVGSTSSYGPGDRACYVIRTDSQGNPLWERTYGGTGIDIGRSIQEMNDDRYIIAGWTESFGAGGKDIYVVVIDSLGDTLCTRAYGGTEDDICYSIERTADNACVLAGYTGSYGAGGKDVYLIKIDVNGELIWTKTYGGAGEDVGRSVQQTIDGGYIIAGSTNSYGSGNTDVWLIKTDVHGTVTWTRTYGPGLWYHWYGYSVQQVSDNGYVITGASVREVGFTGVLCIKTDSVGDTLWTDIYGPGVYSEGLQVIETSDNCYVIVGQTFIPVLDYLCLMKIDSSGNSLWSTNMGTGGEAGSGVQQTSDNGYIVVGETNIYSPGGSDVWLIKTEPDEGIVEEKRIVLPPHEKRTTIVSGPLRLPNDKNYQIFDITGREVDAKHMKPGVYFIKFEGEMIQKIIKVK